MAMRILLVALSMLAVSEAYNQTLPTGNTTVFGIKEMSYGTHVFAWSDKGLLVHQIVQTANFSNQGEWYLMPNPHSGSTPSGDLQSYDSNPIVGQNPDGHLEIFMRSHISLDFWHWYQVNASDPFTWVGPREPACLCNFPPCEGQTKCGNNANCGNDGYNCAAPGFENEGPKWWNTQAVFPTSDGTFVTTKEGGLRLYFRGFDGLMYAVEQEIPGNSTKYTAPTGWGTLLE